MADSRKLVTATVFGVLIATVKARFTFPVPGFLNTVEVPLLGLSFLMLGAGGATLRSTGRWRARQSGLAGQLETP